MAEAPQDGTPYNRQDGNWVAAASAGVEEAPEDGTPYARQDATWVALSGGGDMLKATYDADNNGVVDEAESVAWTGVTGAPSFITSTGVTYANLNANGDVGTGAAQVAAGNHTHAGVYSPVAHTHEGTAILSTGEAGGSKFLREDGDGTCSWQSVPAGHNAVTLNAVVTDVLSLSTQEVSAVDATANKIVYWNDTSNKLTYGTVSEVGAAAASHNHSATDITSGTLSTDRFSAYSDLTAESKIGTGAAQVAAGDHTHAQLHDAATVSGNGIGISGQQISLNIGTGATDVAAGNHTHAQLHDAATVSGNGIGISGQQISLNIGTGATDVAAGNHTHAQLHDRSHAMTGTSDHTAGNWKVFYSNGSGQVVELALGSDGEFLKSNGASAAPTFATPTGGAHDAVTLGASVIDILSLSTQQVNGVDAGADKPVYWNDTSNKLTYGAFNGTGDVARVVSPTFTTPTLGVASATSVNKVAITAPASAATLTLSDGSSLITSGGHSITLTSGGATNVTLPTSGTLATTAQLHDAVTLDANAGAILGLSTQQLTLDTQVANRVFAGPTTGADAVPTFRALVAGDIPSLSSTYAVVGAIGSSGLTMNTARLLGRTTASSGAVEEMSVGAGLSLSAGSLASTTTTSAIGFVIDGGGSAITTGIKGDIEVTFACTITAARLLADQSGSIAVGVWKDTYANFPPTVDDLIDTFSITTATKSEETGLSLAVAAGSILRFNVDSASTITRATLSLTVTRA